VVFFRRRPELGEKAARFFKDQQLWIKNNDEYQLFRPDTGSPLGMFVEGYTLLQYALHEVNLSHIEAPSSKFMFSATNDDMVVGSRDLSALEEYLQADERNNSALGMSYKDTKSGISTNRFVYCEEYWIDDHIDPKDALLAVTLIGAKQCFSAFHAKEYCYSVMLSAEKITLPILNALREVQSCIGFEFHEDEFNYPYLFGGWLPQIKSGLDHSIEWFDGDLKAVAGYWASQTKLPKKGKLSEVPHLTIGRKLGLKLIEEPSDGGNWIDLVPFFGTKKTLERHYRTSVRNPRSVHREYLLMSKLRQQAYQGIMDGSRDARPVYEGWLRRHPSSYIPDNLPILETGTAYTRVVKPRMGVKQRSFIHKLLCLRKKGFIDCDAFGIVSNTTIKIMEKGFQDTCPYQYLPIHEKGFSSLIFSEHLKGYQSYYERTGKVIIAYDEQDQPVIETALWGMMPWASFLTTCRMYAYGLSYFKRPLDFNLLVVLGGIHRQMSDLEAGPDYANDEDFVNSDVVPERSELLAELVRDVIRDWTPNPDDVISSMGERFISRAHTKEVSSDILMRLGMLRTETVSLYPVALDGETDYDIASGSDPPSEFEDPWAELGV